MKRITVFLIVAVLFVGAVSAQETTAPQRRASEPVTVSGTLKLENGFIALQSGDTTYYVPGLNRYVGFIDGLKEGSNVSVEGRTFRNILMPSKLTVSGRSYELAAGNAELRSRFQQFNQGRGNQGRGNLSQGRNNFQRHNAPGRNNAPKRIPNRRVAPGRCPCAVS